MSEQREMTLDEWVNRLPKFHLANKQYQKLQQRVTELERHNDELTATIYRLRDALQTHTAQPVCCGNVDIEYSPDGEPIGQHCCGWVDFECPQDVVELLSATSQQNLNAVKRASFIVGYTAGNGYPPSDWEVDQYIKSIKEGE